MLNLPVAESHPYFATGAGGLLQDVLAGFGGLRITMHGIVQLPTALPGSRGKLFIIGADVNNELFEVMDQHMSKLV